MAKKKKKNKEKVMDNHVKNMKSIILFMSDLENKDVPPEVAYATLRNLVFLETSRVSQEGKYDDEKLNRSEAIQAVMSLMAYAHEHGIPIDEERSEESAEETEKPNSHRPGYL